MHTRIRDLDGRAGSLCPLRSGTQYRAGDVARDRGAHHGETTAGFDFAVELASLVNWIVRSATIWTCRSAGGVDCRSGDWGYVSQKPTADSNTRADRRRDEPDADRDAR